MLLLLLYVMAVVRIVLALALSLVHRVTASTAVQVGIVVAQQSILHGRWQTLLLLLLVMILLAPRVLLLLLEILSMVWLLLLLGLGSSSSTARETIALEVVRIDLLRLLLLWVIGWRWTRGKGHKLVGVRRQTRGPDQCGIAQVQSCKRERIRAQSTQSQPATKIVQQV